MIYPTVKQLTNDEFNRYELALATAKCARIVTDEYVAQREIAEKNIADKKTEKTIASQIDKDIRDVLWPASCTLLSIERGPNKTNKIGIAEGDILTVHYTTYDPAATATEFEVLVGDQSEEIDKIMRPE